MRENRPDDFASAWIAAGYDQWPHFVRVDCDWYADGLWDERGAMYSLPDMPISAEPSTAIAAWQVIFNDRQPGIAWSDTEERAHVATATALARRLKQVCPRCLVVAIDRRIRDDLSLGERVPFPASISSQTNRRVASCAGKPIF